MKSIVDRVREMNAEESIAPIIDELRGMSMRALRELFVELFKHGTASHNKEYLYKRVAYRLQEIREQLSLSQDALAKAQELAANDGARVRPPQGALANVPPMVPPSDDRDPRLPPAGTVLHKELRGEVHEVTVLHNGFVYRGKRFESLSQVATHIAGTRYNGFTFFGLARRNKR